MRWQAAGAVNFPAEADRSIHASGFPAGKGVVVIGIKSRRIGVDTVRYGTGQMNSFAISRSAGWLLLASLAASPAHADETYTRCMDASDGTNPAWANCGWAWVKREDDRLNQVWKQVREGLEGQTREDLLAEQRAWILYREKACAYYNNGEHGREGQVIGYPTCLAKMIAARTAELEQFGEASKDR